MEELAGVGSDPDEDATRGRERQPARAPAWPGARSHAGGGSAAEAAPVLHLLVMDEDDSVRNACSDIARKRGFAVVGAPDLASARAILKHRKIDIVLLDLKSSGRAGIDLLEEVKLLNPDTSVIVMTAFATVASAVEAMRVGAGDYLTKPFALDELVTVLERAGERTYLDLESRRLRELLRNPRGAGQLIGHSPEMEKLYRIVSKVAHSSHPVLVLGESGTGKEVVARSIHFNGPHAMKPFVPVDCGSLLPERIESELFGYVKGAFVGSQRTAATHAKEGLLTSRAGGTVFLDEIAELPLELQSRLLRALKEKHVLPIGGSQAVPVTARVLTATNRDLAFLVEQGKFRKDLFYQLNVVNLRIPPLRDRREDIPVLAQHFVERVQKETGVGHSFSDEALRALVRYDWPGNVRELENAVERACALSSGPVLHMADLPTQLHAMALEGLTSRMPAEPEASGMAQGAAAGGSIVSIADLERSAILGTIRQLKGDKLMAAKLLGIGKTTLYRKLKEYGISEGLDEEP